ncbi:helix-hairpin-helix domain-containing protein [Algoriphagus halophytocola]|uniref:Helix-hairpin-helix domain-containing protein n=1 Tax=Algoriphagus halophytocola TaxID=2991499 RepID=A0ABY6MFZ9_9BACT|nr:MULTISPECIES: helix-hairpin-helix domain-containing protein [unclassified Algoriphagus]UZD22712.1 helix-hairpin-helix domain-containing protein [Algoriphagus sp. TR-M5]WBL43977.1 helix-hairpin-helix domain-containing protein [Algoriphagus sp. TR-M9]
MKTRFFYWMKTYLGFSRKETQGFVLLIPALLMLVLIPEVLGLISSARSRDFHIQYQTQLDSIQKAGFDLIGSPGPVFNPQDTVENKQTNQQSENLIRIPFSEADSVTLQIVPGVGPATASRIVKFRESLGGLHHKNQLYEVYGIKPETADGVWEFFDFSPQVFRKIQINEVEVGELAKHPYISYSEAKVLIAYRTQHGNYRSVDDLQEIKIFRSEWIAKISPYLDFQ